MRAEDKKALFQADTTVTLVGIKPSTRGGLAVLQWTNPSGGGGRRRPALQPAAMQCALHHLPCAGDGTLRWVWALPAQWVAFAAASLSANCSVT